MDDAAGEDEKADPAGTTKNPITFQIPSFEATTEPGSFRAHTRYTIVMKDAEMGNSWTSKKRYSEFDAFRKTLGEFASGIPFPKKTYSISFGLRLAMPTAQKNAAWAYARFSTA